MARKERKSPQFNLAFLDVMCCGFGAVVLLVMLLNGKMLTHRKEIVADLQSEATRLDREVQAGQRYLVELRNSLEQSDQEIVRTEGASRRVLEQIERTRRELAELKRKSRAERRHVKALQADLLKLDQQQRRLAVQQRDADRGRQARSFIGQGDRQYLTGLRLGGKRVLLLVDASASMLDETILNVIVRRNLGADEKRSAPKWRRTVKTVEWLTANLPVDSRLQILLFNTAVKPVVEELQGTWVAVGDRPNVDRLLAALRQVVPADGTSLYQAFAAAARLRPRPDNILLLTDGLPTQGSSRPRGSRVSGEERLRLFKQAVRKLPAGVPVNIILFPMEGDPLAAISFWQLGLTTGGSFLTPTRDWP
ncbi:vWA domain-containing protein [Geothermobacter hydrogeniphilus]|uniref:VWFA domain-containing protein n=1 Tax=Geothermobacter hydrogeniphilus TaxID=1969733 RepID=A0A1X0YCP7_9BACT|nr:vWA domain-containing protein [Geothermobacter hydrogeniphilus]ORJ62869.1 hypothetical protein B5V00_02090 [Geothermobacter hydrogeniphilus]